MCKNLKNFRVIREVEDGQKLKVEILSYSFKIFHQGANTQICLQLFSIDCLAYARKY